jgi:uncharacterized protein YbcI
MPGSDSYSEDLDMRNPATAGVGEQLRDISDALVQLYKDGYGKGPTKARAYMAGDLVVCLLEGGFLTGEKTLRNAGRGAAVSDSRGVLQEVMRQRFIDTIEGITRRKVVTFISGVDVQTETNAELFVLEPLELETGDEHQAVGAWDEQTRRQSRALRGDQSALRTEQARLREQSATGRREGPRLERATGAARSMPRSKP